MSARPVELDRDPVGPFHDGERWVQERAGTRASASRVGRIIRPDIAPMIGAFLESAPIAAMGAIDADARVWASMVVGREGFLRARAAAGQTALTRLWVGACPRAGDALAHVVCPARVDRSTAAASVGLVAIDFATRRRVRVNGVLSLDEPGGDGGFTIAVQQAYGNCPKYIQARAVPTANPDSGPGDRPRHGSPGANGTIASPSQRALISTADTMFVASVGPDGSADASHRGGPPGFIDVLDGVHLRIPDYSGNTMFNTLGNLAADPRIGLAIPDFSSGTLLQVSGRASINWSEDIAARYLAAERVLDVVIERVVEVPDALPVGWTYLDASPFNPPGRRR